MKTRNTITICRETFMLSQQALADYLQVSRSLLNMAERGERELPAHAFLWLTHLISSYDPSTPAQVPPERTLKAREKRLEQLRNEEKEKTWQLEKLTEQLAALETSYHHALCQARTYQKIRQQLTADNHLIHKGQVLWLDLREEEVWQRVDRNSPEEQMPLRVKIATLLALLRENRQLITEIRTAEAPEE